MSLINDVLRQLDSKPNGNAEIFSILPSALIEKDNEQDKIKVAITIVAAVILLIYFSQLILGQPLLSLLTNTVEQESTLQTSISQVDSVGEATNVELANTKPANTNSIYIEPKKVSRVQLQTEVKEEEEKVLLISSKKIVEGAKEIEGKQPIAKPVPAAIAISDLVIINEKIKSWEENQYQAALRFFIDGNIIESNRIIKQVLESRVKDEYLGLQARIYIKQNDANSFYELVKQNPNSNSIDWYKLVAPGLQLFSYYQLSNQYYYSLANIEPQQISWQLAIALNYLRLDKEDKALTIYHNLYQSEQTSNRQKQWLKNKMKRLSLNKA